MCLLVSNLNLMFKNVQKYAYLSLIFTEELRPASGAASRAECLLFDLLPLHSRAAPLAPRPTVMIKLLKANHEILGQVCAVSCGCMSFATLASAFKTTRRLTFRVTTVRKITSSGLAKFHRLSWCIFEIPSKRCLALDTLNDAH